MAKLTDIIVIDAYTLELNTDAKKGDRIDLRDLIHVDTDVLVKKIEAKKDELYEQRLSDLERRFASEKEQAVLSAVGDKKTEIVRLETELKNQKEQLTMEIEKAYELKVAELKHAMENLKRDQEHAIQKLQLEQANQYNNQIHQAEKEINQLKNELKTNALLSESEKRTAVLEKEQELKEQIKEKELLIDRLNQEKSTLNIKQMGEYLEKWVNEEYQNHALNGFETCIWEKDNIAVRSEGEHRGTKADYLFKVYATEEKTELDLLASVAIEIKSEAIDSKNKTKNADHYEKLHKDRLKKNCEYALLISELEWETANDAPIRKVPQYEKMYMVRPQYFIVFLNIIVALGLKYKEIVKGYHFERAQFKDAEDILAEFETMKDEILTRSINYIENQVTQIEKRAQNIKADAEEITKATKIILETHLQTVINKINQFKINRITQKIDKLND